MYLRDIIINFIIDEWFYVLLRGKCHLFIAFFGLLFLLRVGTNLRIISVVFISLFTQVGAFLLFGGMALSIGLGFGDSIVYKTSFALPSVVCFSLGFLYTFLQTILFSFCSWYYEKLTVNRFFIMSFLSNFFASMISYWLFIYS